MHTLYFFGRNCRLPHYAYNYTYWQELSSAPLHIHTVVHLYLLAGTVICPITHTYNYIFILIGRNCHLPHYAYIQLYIYTYWQELSSAPLRIHTVIHLYLLAETVICPITHTYSYTFILIGRNCHLPHYAYIQLYIYTYWQELSSAPLRIHIVINLYLLTETVICPITHTYNYTFILIGRNCHLPHYAYIQLYIYTYWQELSSAPLRIHTVIQLYLLAGTVICPIAHIHSYASCQELSYRLELVKLVARNCYLPHYTYHYIS